MIPKAKPAHPASRRASGQPPSRKPETAQPKAIAARIKQPPTAPPAYRPQGVPAVLQRKTLSCHAQRDSLVQQPVNGPQPLTKALQMKPALRQSGTNRTVHQVVALPVVYPQPTRIVQSAAKVAHRVIQRAQAPAPLRGVWAARVAQQPAPQAPPPVVDLDELERQQQARLAALELARQQAAEARRVAAALLAERQRTATKNIILTDSATNHCTDGWGATYGITTAEEVRARVRTEWVDGENNGGGQITVGLGTHTVGQQTRVCSLLYRKNWRNNLTQWDVTVWHCGPALLGA